MKKQFLITPFSLLFPFFSSLTAQSAFNVTLLDSFIAAVEYNSFWVPDSDRCSGIWGWTDQSGNEYALMGLFYRGLGVFDVTNPYDIEMVGDTLPGEATHEVKTYENYAYTANKETKYHESTDLRIVRLDLRPPQVVGRIPVGYSPGHDITRVHDLDISDGVMFLACENNVYDSTRYPNMFFYDLQQNPAAPTRIGSWTIPQSITGGQSYNMMMTDGDPLSIQSGTIPWVIEVYVKGNRIYAACQNAGVIVATFDKYYDQGGNLHLDVDESRTWQLTYRNVRRLTGDPPENYRVTHTVKVTDDNRYIFVADETLPDYEGDPMSNKGGVLRMFDISNIESLPAISQQTPSAFLEPLVLYEIPENQ